ncbi:expressed unknown protein [Seminavis robusta]|uniref:Uncharacterized protein n=1 Tax=Seminavis robusta TaxID=568900 RepID=A0A9N8EUQ2_9STRA|nr:expressed unknown protein [Seminavis robusta]|eukprot:Sro1676_g290430.1 n/a (133) ;mRNA; f:89-487
MYARVNGQSGVIITSRGIDVIHQGCRAKTGRDLMPHRVKPHSTTMTKRHRRRKSSSRIGCRALKQREAEEEANRIMTEQMMNANNTTNRLVLFVLTAIHDTNTQTQQSQHKAQPVKRRKQQLTNMNSTKHNN